MSNKRKAPVIHTSLRLMPEFWLKMPHKGHVIKGFFFCQLAMPLVLGLSGGKASTKKLDYECLCRWYLDPSSFLLGLTFWLPWDERTPQSHAMIYCVCRTKAAHSCNHSKPWNTELKLSYLEIDCLQHCVIVTASEHLPYLLNSVSQPSLTFSS